MSQSGSSLLPADAGAQTPAGRLIADEYFIRAYVGHVKDRTHPDISPIYGNLRGLPPTLLIVGSSDVLVEDNIAMAGRLSAAGNDVELRIYPEAPHGFTGHPTAMARMALSGIDSWLLARVVQPQGQLPYPSSDEERQLIAPSGCRTESPTTSRPHTEKSDQWILDQRHSLRQAPW